MAHCQPNAEMEQTQRDLSELHINENQGKTSQTTNYTQNHTTYPTNSEFYQNLEIQKHLFEIEKIKKQNHERHANPVRQHKECDQPQNSYTNRPLPKEPPGKFQHITRHTPTYNSTPPDHINYNTSAQSINRPLSRTSTTSNHKNRDTITPTPRPRSETSKSFQDYRDIKNNSDISFSTTTSTMNEHNCTQIPRTKTTIMQKPRLPYPKPIPYPSNQDTHTTTRTNNFNSANPIEIQTNTQQRHHTPHLRQRAPSPIIQHNEQHQYETQFPTTRPYSPQEIPQQFSLRRSPTFYDLKIVSDIESIIHNDQFVKDLTDDIMNKICSDTESDSDADQHIQAQAFNQKYNSPPIRRAKTPTQTHQQHVSQPKPKITQNPNPEQQKNTQYTVTYDEDNLHCRGRGWQTKFLNHSDETLFKQTRTTSQKPNTTTINTNTPFNDLYTNLLPQTTKQHFLQTNQAENENTTSSNTSIQNLLTSTINESSPPHCILPTYSPITTTAQVHSIANPQHNTNPQQIQQSLKQYQEIDNTLRTDYLHQSDHNNITTHSLPPYETSTYKQNLSLPQTDGNNSDTDSIVDTPTTHTHTNSSTESKITELELQKQTVTKLNQLETTNQSNYLQQSIAILKEARKHHDPTLPETKFQKIIRHKLAKCLRAQTPQETPNQQQNVNTQVDLNNLHQTPHNDKKKEKPTQQQEQHDIDDHIDQDKVDYIIQRNKDIMNNVSTRTLEEEADDEINQITSSLQQITHNLDNLTYNINTQEGNTTSDPNTRSPSPYPSNTFTNHPYINNFEGIIPHQQQDKPLTSNISTVHLNFISSAELRDMEAKVGSRCQDKFDITKHMYEQIILHIETIDLQTRQKVETEAMTPRLVRQLKQTKKQLLRLRSQQLSLEKRLRKISAIEENNNVGILIPIFGNNKKNNRNWKNVPVYNPKNDTSFKTIWKIIVARGHREGLDEESYKEILEEVLKGDALHYYTENQHKSLSTIIEILYNAFVTTKSRQQISSQLDNFRAEKKDTFRQTLEKLKLVTSELFKDQDLTPEQTARGEEIEIKRRIIENHLVDQAALAAVFRKERECLLEGKRFDFIREITQETDIQREAGNTTTTQPHINTLDLFNTTTTNTTPTQPNKADTQRVHIGNTNQSHISARPRPPSQDKLDRMFRNSPTRFRSRTNTPHTSPHRTQSPSPNRAQTPQRLAANTQRDTENRQRASRQTEIDNRRFNTNARDHQNSQNQPQPQRQQSNDTQFRYNQYTNNQFPQNQKPRSSSTTPYQQPRNQQNRSNRRYDYNSYNNPNYTPIGNQGLKNPHFNNNQPNNNKPYNFNQNQNNKQYRPLSPRQDFNRPRQNQPNPRWNQQTNNQYKPQQNNYDNQQFGRSRILQHNMTYTGGDNREGKISQVFSFSELCRKRVCQNTPEHAYKQCPRPPDFPNRR